LEERDSEVLSLLEREETNAKVIALIGRIFTKDRKKRQGLAGEILVLDAPDELAPHIAHLRGAVLPVAEERARQVVIELSAINEKIARLKDDFERVPAAERIATLQIELEGAQNEHKDKLAELEKLRVRKEILHKQRTEAEIRLDKLGGENLEFQLSLDDRQRMLKHSEKARNTLNSFRTNIVKQHVGNMETLMLESFQKLLRKSELAKGLKINPETFEATLFGGDGNALPFDRLSAGERQLLATSMLWGLARASGRPVPTVIDTPLGRLDSDHRTNLIERYFPNASHQVILLSTNEEIVNGYLKKLAPYIARTYLLEHNEKRGQTKIVEGYFA